MIDEMGRTNRIVTWFQRYPLPLSLDFARSAVVFTIDSQRVVAGFTTAARVARFGRPSLPARPAKITRVVLVAGNQSAQSLERVRSIKDKIVLYVPPPNAAAGEIEPWMFAVDWERGNQAVVVLSAEDSDFFSLRLQTGLHQVIRQTQKNRWTVYVRPELATGLSEVLAAAGVDLAQCRADTTPVIRDLPSLQIALDVQARETNADTATAPNVIGVLEGSDSALKNEFLVFTAHMDRADVRPDHADSIAKGRLDNVWGVAGLLSLANAFSHPDARPRRSMIFVATSGGAKPAFWGSSAFVDGLLKPTILGLMPVIKVIANINLDVIEGGARDSVTVDGLRNLELKVPPDWVAAAHPELGLTVVDGGSPFSPRSDHYAFTRSSLLLPAFSFRNGWPQDGKPELAIMNAEQAARIVRLVFYVGQEVADAEQRPRWNENSRRSLAFPGSAAP
jgi:hypothetical protein